MLQGIFLFPDLMDMDLTLINYSFLENAGPLLLLVAIRIAIIVDIAIRVSVVIVGVHIAVGVGIQIQIADIAIRIVRIEVARALIRIPL